MKKKHTKIQIALGCCAILCVGAWGVLSHSQDIVNAEMQRLFLATDVNHDGTLTKKELEQVLSQKIKLLDLNHDGYISLKEQSVIDETCRDVQEGAKDAFGCRLNIKKEIEKIVAMMSVEDIDHDGRITLTEFQGSSFIEHAKKTNALLLSRLPSVSAADSQLQSETPAL